ncbi:hypothetical protein STEG23_031743, partial [Scotinomys teguina]
VMSLQTGKQNGDHNDEASEGMFLFRGFSLHPLDIIWYDVRVILAGEDVGPGASLDRIAGPLSVLSSLPTMIIELHRLAVVVLEPGSSKPQAGNQCFNTVPLDLPLTRQDSREDTPSRHPVGHCGDPVTVYEMDIPLPHRPLGETYVTCLTVTDGVPLRLVLNSWLCFCLSLASIVDMRHLVSSLYETEKIVLEAGNGLPSWKFNDQLFPCDVCGKVFGRQQTLSRHLSLHTEERKYKCHLCPYAAKCRANLNQHLTVHSVKLVSTDTEDIVSAVTSEGSDGKKHPYYYSCHVCGFETELNVQFVSHMSLHVDKEQWMFSICCTACDFVTMEEAEIKNHIGTKHTGDDRKTPSESNSPSSSSLSTLSDSANGKDDSDSSQKNKGGNNLLVISVVPGSQPSLNSEEKPEKGFECVFCNFVCKTKNMFERHLQIHLITRMFECDVCHKFMKTPEQLLEHKKCHTVPTGGLKCPFCIYSTNRPAAMECHLKTHYKMEYKCRICQTVKTNQLELETHTREHRLGNHYKCDQCGYLSKTANKLIEHVRVHTGERPFHCDQCSYSCKRKDNLNLHKKLKHAPRQTFSCGECLFKTTHPFVFSRHVKKHQSGDGPEEDKKGLSPASREPTGPGAPLLVVGSGRSLLSPLSLMSASQALQTVALSAAHGSSSEPNLALKALAFNGSPLRLDKYRNSDFAHLIPLTMLYPKSHLDLTFHPPRPQTAPPSIPSPKHSFLAYLGLRERAETV